MHGICTYGVTDDDRLQCWWCFNQNNNKKDHRDDSDSSSSDDEDEEIRDEWKAIKEKFSSIGDIDDDDPLYWISKDNNNNNKYELVENDKMETTIYKTTLKIWKLLYNHKNTNKENLTSLVIRFDSLPTSMKQFGVISDIVKELGKLMRCTIHRNLSFCHCF